MRKFSKLTESVKISNDKIESALDKLENAEYKIFDYYYISKYNKVRQYDHIYLSDDFENILPGTKNAKVILINRDFDYTNVELQKWDSNLKFQSSGFYFLNDTTTIRKQFDQIFNLLEELKDYSPKVCIKDNRFVIYLIGDEISNLDLELLGSMASTYEKLYQKLEPLKHLFKNVYFNKERSKVSVVGKNEDIMMSVLASLCTHLSKQKGYEWLTTYKKDDDLEDVRDIIREMGFNITYSQSGHDRDDDPIWYFKLIEI